MYRFQARFVDPSPEDAIRKFVIQLYPQDDTLGISEPPVRNSGVLGGKFLARSKYRKADGCKCSDGPKAHDTTCFHLLRLQRGLKGLALPQAWNAGDVSPPGRSRRFQSACLRY